MKEHTRTTANRLKTAIKILHDHCLKVGQLIAENKEQAEGPKQDWLRIQRLKEKTQTFQLICEHLPIKQEDFMQQYMESIIGQIDRMEEDFASLDDENALTVYAKWGLDDITNY